MDNVVRMVYFLMYLSSVAGLFPVDSECGRTKGCFSDCADSGTSYEISWSSASANTIQFTIKSELVSNIDQYAAFGLSTTQSMADASVSSCLMTSSGGSFAVQNSYNDPGNSYSNSPVTNPTDGISSTSGSYIENTLTCTFERTVTNSDPKVFDLYKEYYMLYAKGTVSGGAIQQHSGTDRKSSSIKINLQSLTNTCPGRNIRVQVHGSCAVIAWMIMANLGYVIARYYRPLFPDKQILGANVWFLIHRISMVSAAILTVCSFIIIIYDNTDGQFHVGSNNFERSHPYIGILIFCFVIVNPIIGLLRPDKDHRFRPVFYWTHYLIGCGTIILALINVFIGLRLQEAEVSDKGYYVFIAYECFQIPLIVVLEVLKIIESKTHITNTGEFEMKYTKDSSLPQQDEKSTASKPFAWTAKLILLCLDVMVTLFLSFGIVGIIGSGLP